jgi:DNA primase
VSDKYESVRSLPFPALASVLGIDMARFKRRQADWQGFCPIHQSKTNNNCFAYHDSGKFHCFSCGAKGAGAIDLTKLVKNLGFQAAVELLQPLVGQAVQTPAPAAIASPDANSSVLQPFKGSYAKFAKPCAWLTARCLDETVLKRFGVFFYENNARKSAVNGHVLIPIKDVEGVLYGYLARNIGTPTDSSPKYRFPANLPKSRFLFGAAELKAGTFGPAPLKLCYLVESPFCVLRFAMYGLPALGLYGWAISPEQLALVRQLARGVVFLPDRNKWDEASQQVSAIAHKLWVRMPELPQGVDDPEALPDAESVLSLTK